MNKERLNEIIIIESAGKCYFLPPLAQPTHITGPIFVALKLDRIHAFYTADALFDEPTTNSSRNKIFTRGELNKTLSIDDGTTISLHVETIQRLIFFNYLSHLLALVIRNLVVRQIQMNQAAPLTLSHIKNQLLGRKG